MSPTDRDGTSCRRRRMPRTRRSYTSLVRDLQLICRATSNVEGTRGALTSSPRLCFPAIFSSKSTWPCSAGARFVRPLVFHGSFVTLNFRRLSRNGSSSSFGTARTHPDSSSSIIGQNSRPVTRSGSWKAHFMTVSEFTTVCRTVSGSRSFSICSVAKSAYAWMPRPSLLPKGRGVTRFSERSGSNSPGLR